MLFNFNGPTKRNCMFARQLRYCIDYFNILLKNTFKFTKQKLSGSNRELPNIAPIFISLVFVTINVSHPASFFFFNPNSFYPFYLSQPLVINILC